MADFIGRQLGQYRIIDQLGQGGMATVYRAEQSAVRRQVALKVIRADLANNEDFLKRFEREAATIATLSHPHILKLFDYGRVDDVVYLVMELLRGGSLSRLIQADGLTPARVAQLLDQIADALDYAHSQNVIHRDLKPHNILLDESGNAFLSDFGIVKLLGDAASALTVSGTLVGTPAYIAPEIWRGQPANARTDIYALGVMLFEMLTRRVPFAADTPYNVMYKHLHETPPPLSNYRADVPITMNPILLKALAKEPALRYEKARMLAADFRTASETAPGRPSGAILPEEGTVKFALPINPASKTPAQTPSIGATPSSVKPTDRLDDPTLAVTPAMAQEQEQQALAQLETELKQRPPPAVQTRSRIINLLPQDAGDRFRDRVKQQADIVTLLSEQTRLVSIYGRGGVGKSALASRVLSNLYKLKGAEAFQGMVLLSAGTTGLQFDRIMSDFLKLLTGEARELVELAIQDPQSTVASKVNTLLGAFGEGRYILLLDNLEAVQASETGEITDPDLRTFVETALGQASGLRILVTSREPLALPRSLKTWERLVPLEEGLPSADAVALLRALDADKTLGLANTSELLLTTLAERLRGFPRALEAAVGLLLEDPLLTVEELVEDTALFNDEITAVIVQQAIARLSPKAVRVMEGLALFQRPVPQIALEFLLAPHLNTSTLRATLARLVRGFFASYNKATQTFAIHKIDQAYCMSRIPTGATADLVGEKPVYGQVGLHRRAADYYLRQRYPETDWISLDALEPQLAEFEHAVAAQDFDRGADVLATIDAHYLFTWGFYRVAVERHEQLRDRVADSYKRIRQLRFLGGAYRLIGRTSEAVSALQTSLEAAQRIQDRVGEHAALNALSVAHMDLSQTQTAINFAEQALAIVRELNERDKESYILCNLGILYGYLGRTEMGIDSVQQALQIARELDDHEGEGVNLGNLAELLVDASRYAEAIERANEAEKIGISLNSPEIINISCYVAALALLASDDLKQARTVADRGIGADYEPNNHNMQVLSGIISLRAGDQVAANTAFTKVTETAGMGTNENQDVQNAFALALCGRALLGEGLAIAQAVQVFTKTHRIAPDAGIIARDKRLLLALAPIDQAQTLAPVLQLFHNGAIPG